jgi:hypothetical protein
MAVINIALNVDETHWLPDDLHKVILATLHQDGFVLSPHLTSLTAYFKTVGINVVSIKYGAER